LGNTIANQNVFDTRVTTFFEKELPLINIMTLKENDDVSNEGYSHNRPLYLGPLWILAVISANVEDSPGVVIDNFCEQIMSKLDRHLGGNATRCEYTGTEIQIHADGTVPHLMAILTYDLEY